MNMQPIRNISGGAHSLTNSNDGILAAASNNTIGLDESGELYACKMIEV